MRLTIEIIAAALLVFCLSATSAAFAAGTKTGRSADGLSCGSAWRKMPPPPRAAPRSAASAAANSTPIIAATSCCRRCEVSNVAAFFTVQSHLAVAPFAKIALAFEATGVSQCPDAHANHFVINRER
jgi:hypothetical protein